MADLAIRNLVKRYDKTEVLHGISLDVEDGEFVVFVGPSGCGKSTTLRLIAGLEDATQGEIAIGGRVVNNLEPKDRDIAMVFQNYAIYPHMTVRKNIGFGLRTAKMSKADKDARIDEVSGILGMTDLLARKPSQLSGGQRQRVAIGRAMVRDPAVFLFDEPLSNLDAELRVDMRVEIARLHKDIGATMIYVTHDQVEAMTLADKIVVLRAGRIEQVGSPMTLYSDPDNKFVAGFIGSPSMNFIEGTVQDGSVAIPAFGGLTVEPSVALPKNDEKVLVGLRPQHLVISETDEGAKVDLSEQLGGVAYSYLVCQTGERVIIETKGEDVPRPDSAVAITFDPANAFFFDAKTEQRLR